MLRRIPWTRWDRVNRAILSAVDLQERTLAGALRFGAVLQRDAEPVAIRRQASTGRPPPPPLSRGRGVTEWPLDPRNLVKTLGRIARTSVVQVRRRAGRLLVRVARATLSAGTDAR